MFEIGSSLRDARMRQGLDFEEMEMRTKVRAKYLRALESEHFEQLPAHTYIKGFLRTYADALGMDGQLYVDEYNSRFVVGEDQPLRTRRVQRTRGTRQRHESRLVVVALAAIAIVTALVIAAWRFGGTDEPKVEGVNIGAQNATTAPATGLKAGAQAGVSVEIRATRGASFMEVRTGTRAGKPLYQGTLERGQSKQFRSPRLFISVAAPGNVEVRADGARVKIPAGGELSISHGTGARP